MYRIAALLVALSLTVPAGAALAQSADDATPVFTSTQGAVAPGVIGAGPIVGLIVVTGFIGLAGGSSGSH